MKFNKRNIFPISNYLWKRGHDFNIFTFYIDVLIITTPIGITLALLIANLISK